MKILVFVKQVPDTDDVKLDPKTGNLKREGVQSMINPLDANAIEAAVQLKEKYGGTVAAISMGPPQAEDMLKKALALGCDEAYLLSDRAFGGADTLATAYTLAKAAEKIGDCDRNLEDCTQRVKAKLPALVTVCGEINTPRYATPINIMKALKKPRTVWDAAALEADTTRTGIPGSPSSTKKVFEPEKRNTDTKYFEGSAEDMAVQFVDMLANEHLV